LADFLKERAKLEEENSKAHAKLSKQVNRIELLYHKIFLKYRSDTNRL
jgi:hypothetical protein